MVLSETCLSTSIQKRLLTHISKLEAIKDRSHRRGFKIEIDINVKVDYTVDIGSGCKGEEACMSRVVWDRHVATRLTGADCPICMTELLSARGESHGITVFPCFPLRMCGEVAK